MNFGKIRYQTDRLRSIPLISVLRAHGAQPDRCDKSKWHTTQGVISLTGTKFYNWNQSVGGGGAIDLVIHLNGVDFKDAISWLYHNTNVDFSFQPVAVNAKQRLQLPPPYPDALAAVKRYLTLNRHIARSVIDPLLRKGTIYADSHANAVFLLLGKNNTPVGAELRGTTTRLWHGMAPGSQKDRGFFSIAVSTWKGIILCESAIDALSCFMIHPEYKCVSTAGARPNPPWLSMVIRETKNIYCGFDNDKTGNTMAQSMIEAFPMVKRLAPNAHDWNDMLKEHSLYST